MFWSRNILPKPFDGCGGGCCCCCCGGGGGVCVCVLKEEYTNYCVQKIHVLESEYFTTTCWWC